MKKILFPVILILGIVSIFLILIPISKREQPESETFIHDNPQWHLPEGAQARIGKGTVSQMLYSPDGNILAVVSAIGIWLYDAHSGEKQSLLTGHTSIINSIAFSPDGKILASGMWRGPIYLWDTVTGKQKKILKGHTRSVTNLSFCADAQMLASASVDGTVLLWDLTSLTNATDSTK